MMFLRFYVALWLFCNNLMVVAIYYVCTIHVCYIYMYFMLCGTQSV